MGMNIQGGGGNRYGGGRRAYRPMAEINVTPFIDVMLVLLIVFMVTAPLLNAGVQVDLPKTSAASITDNDDKPLEVTVDKVGNVFIGETPVTTEELMAKLSAITGDDFERRIFIRADQTLSYGKVMEVLGAVNGGGYRKVALISEPASRRK